MPHHHAILGPTPDGPLLTPTRVSSLAQAQRLLGRLDAPGPASLALTSAANLFMNGADRVTLVRLPTDPTDDDLHAALRALPDAPLSIAIPGLTDPDRLIAAAHVTAAALPDPTPLLWADLDAPTPDLVRRLIAASHGVLAPVLPTVTTQGPGRLSAAPFPASTLAGAAWAALPGPLKGLHSLPGRTPDRAALIQAGAAAIIPAPGRRPVLTIALPPRLAARLAPPRPPAPVDPLEADLRAIIDQGRAAPGSHDPTAQVLRMLTMRLHRAWQQGAIVGERPEQAFRVEAAGRNRYNVWLRRPSRVREFVLTIRGD